MFQVNTVEVEVLPVATAGDNFEQENQVREPSSSSTWDTSPEASTINFFGGMVDVQNYRLFGGNEEDENRRPNENENEGNDQIEVIFGFPILDETYVE